jgi:tRNA threonylcarbamoyladenosine biosynthesis protein TsaE
LRETGTGGTKADVEPIDLSLPTRRATRRLAAAIGGALTPGDMVVLEGDLGSGKTFLVRGIARALGVPSRVRVTSPTFALVNEHSGRVPIVHADLYRLADASDLTEVGLSERVGGEAVVLVEWGERFADELGHAGLWVFLSLAAEGRSATLLARGDSGRALLQRVVEDPQFVRLR